MKTAGHAVWAIVLAAMVCGLSAAQAQATQSTPAGDTARKLIGEWNGTDDAGVTGGFKFKADGNAAIVRSGITLDGPSVGGKFVWKVDDSHSPIHLDFVMTRADGQTKTIELILKFVSDNQIVLRADWNTGKRPDGFVENDPDTQITLTRQPLP